jgi:hypothetical protein
VAGRNVIRSERQAAALAGLLACATHACAAGGHHAVDDASILEPGQCQAEVWVDRETGGERSTRHVGPACGIGRVEVGVSVDQTRLAATSSTTAISPQLKWATAWNERLSVGLAVSAAWKHSAPRYMGAGVIVPLTWQPSDMAWVHLNVGRDFRHRTPDAGRAGIALEWAPLPAWSFIAERFTESSTPFARVGARCMLTPALALDLSRARGLSGRAPAWWTFGAAWEFDARPR